MGWKSRSESRPLTPPPGQREVYLIDGGRCTRRLVGWPRLPAEVEFGGGLLWRLDGTTSTRRPT